MPKKTKNSLGLLKAASRDTAELFTILSNSSETGASQRSEVLFGALGGGVGIAAAYALSIAIPITTFALMGPIMACVGIPLGILIWRGPGYFRRERRRRNVRELLKDIEELPPDTPASIRSAYWDEVHNEIRSGTGGQQLNLPPSSLVDVPAQLSLPPPSADVRIGPASGYAGDQMKLPSSIDATSPPDPPRKSPPLSKSPASSGPKRRAKLKGSGEGDEEPTEIVPGT